MLHLAELGGVASARFKFRFTFGVYEGQFSWMLLEIVLRFYKRKKIDILIKDPYFHYFSG